MQASETSVTCTQGGAGGLSSGSLWLISVSSYSEENSGQEILSTHKNRVGGRASSTSIKGTSNFLTWKVTRKEKGSRWACSGLPCGAAAGTSASRISGGAAKKPGCGQREFVFQERLVGEKHKYAYLKDNYTVAKNPARL